MPTFLNLGVLPFALRVLLFILIIFFLLGDCCDSSKSKIIQVDTAREDSIITTTSSIAKDLNYVEYPRPEDFVEAIQNRIVSGQNDDTSYVIYPYEPGDIK